MKYPSGRLLLNEVCKVVDNNKLDWLKKVESVALLFQKNVSGLIKEDGVGIIELLNIYVLCLRCLSDNPDEKYVIVFDNFERFITKDEIYNKDVEYIRSIPGNFADTINLPGNVHRGYFKFVMVVRDSTARMYGVRLQASDLIKMIENVQNELEYKICRKNKKSSKASKRRRLKVIF